MSSKSEAELRRERIMARGTDRLARLERARLEETPAEGMSNASSSGASTTPAQTSAAPETASPVKLTPAEHFPAPRQQQRQQERSDNGSELRRAQQMADALTGDVSAGDASGLPDPFEMLQQMMGQMAAGQPGGGGGMGGFPGAGAGAGQGQGQMPPDPMAMLTQMLGAAGGPGGATNNPAAAGLLGKLAQMAQPPDPQAAERAAQAQQAAQETLRRARPWRIVGMLCSMALAIFALYLLATSSSVADYGGVDQYGDEQAGEYVGWRSGLARISRLRVGAREVLDDLGKEAVGYVGRLAFRRSLLCPVVLTFLFFCQNAANLAPVLDVRNHPPTPPLGFRFDAQPSSWQQRPANPATKAGDPAANDPGRWSSIHLCHRARRCARELVGSITVDCLVHGKMKRK